MTRFIGGSEINGETRGTFTWSKRRGWIRQTTVLGALKDAISRRCYSGSDAVGIELE